MHCKQQRTKKEDARPAGKMRVSLGLSVPLIISLPLTSYQKQPFPFRFLLFQTIREWETVGCEIFKGNLLGSPLRLETILTAVSSLQPSKFYRGSADCPSLHQFSHKQVKCKDSMKIEKLPQTVYHKDFSALRAEIYRRKNTYTMGSLSLWLPSFLILGCHLFARTRDIFVLTINEGQILPGVISASHLLGLTRERERREKRKTRT